jgi:hypothetical protein
MTTLSQAALWLVNQGAQTALGPEPRYWQYGTTMIPRNAYHQVVILVVGDYSISMQEAIPGVFEKQAKDAGFRLLKVQKAGGQIQFQGLPADLYVGFVSSDVWAKTANELSQALQGAPVVFDSQEVGPVEAASLDALWVATGAAGTVGEVQLTHGVKIDYWPLIGAGIALMSVSFLLYTIFQKTRSAT